MRHHEVERLNDDRAGRCPDRLFDALDADLIMKVVRQVIDQFQINLDELHNDSTSVSFYGAYLLFVCLWQPVIFSWDRLEIHGR